MGEPDRRVLAEHVRKAVTDAGGAEIWLKHSASSRRPEASLQVLATPAAYRAVLAAVQQAADHDQLELEAAASNAVNARHAVNLILTGHGQRVMEIHLREVPRLLRAAIVIDDMGRTWTPRTS